MATAIYLINRSEARRVIKSHLDRFRHYLGLQVTADDVLKALENAQSIMDETLSDNEELLGILLGYGVVNAQKFQEFTDLQEIKSKTPVFPKQLYTAETNAPWERMIQRIEWNSELHVKRPVHVEVEPELVATKLKSIKWEEFGTKNDPLAQISLPSFRRIAGDREGGQWLQTYRMTRPKITAVLNSPDFLKIVLSEISK